MTVDGAPAAKASRQVSADEQVVVRGEPARFVSRGGEKLAAALDEFGVDPTGQRWLDAGSSTGGFTDCLLQRGARAVAAVDVGRGQLHARLLADPRVASFEQTHLRDVTVELLDGPVDGVCADLSFISLRKVVDPLLDVVRPDGPLVLLVKPQFEAGRAEVSHGRGIIREPEVWARVLREVIDALIDRGATIMDTMVSPLRGAEGNVEFFVHALATEDASTSADSVVALIDGAVGRATSESLP